MDSLVDQYCANPHSAAIRAAAHDSDSGALITADEWGTVSITPPGQAYPKVVFDMGVSIQGAVALSPGGSLAAVGDDEGTVAVYRTWDADCVFEDVREGPAGPARAMRALAFNPQGTILATLSIDGILRIFDIQRWERVANYKGFGGESLEFDERGDRILVIDNLGQPKLVDLMSNEVVDLEMVPGGVREARFTPDSRHVVTIGQGGLTLIDLPDCQISASFAAQGSSGMITMVISPDGSQLGAITGRSVHQFSLPDLSPVGSQRHGASDPTEACWWDKRGVVITDEDGRQHRPGARMSLPPLISVAGFGEHRVMLHGDQIAIWQGNRQKRPFKAKHNYIEARIDRDGRLLVALPEDGGMQVYEARTGRHLFDAGPDTTDTPRIDVGGSIVACLLPRGGLRWYDLKNNSVFELPWVRTFALSGSGTWLAVTTPQGRVRVLDPATGKDAIPRPQPQSDKPVELVSFVNRRPDMLVMDADGVLGIYDLAPSVTEKVAAECTDVIDLNVAVDRLWGITGGRYGAVRFQEEESATVIFVDLHSGEVVSEVSDLLPYAWVDPESGHILQPVRGNALLELDMYGKEQRVLRALPEGEWVCIGPQGILDNSSGFTP